MPLTNINLVGPNAPQAVDYQAQLLQQAQAAEMAKALLASSLQQESPIIPTARNNPFGRDVINLAPLGKMAQSYYGGQRLNAANAATQQIANAMQEQMRQEYGAMMDKLAPPGQEMAGPPTPGGETAGTAPSPLSGIIDTIKTGFTSNTPEVRARAGEMAKALMEAEVKQMVTPEAQASAVRAGINPASVTYGKSPLLGVPTMPDPKTLALNAEPVSVAPGHTVTGFVKGGTTATTPESPAPTVASNAGAMAERMGTAQDLRKQLQEGKPAAQAFLTEGPKLQQLIGLIDKGTVATGIGKTGEWLTEARRFAQQTMGVDKATAEKITDTKTLISMLLPVSAEGVHAFTPRGTQTELTQFAKAYGGSTDIDPAAARAMLEQAYAVGMNHFIQHNQNVDLAASHELLGEKSAAIYKVPIKPGQLVDTMHLLDTQSYPYSTELGMRSSGPTGKGTQPNTQADPYAGYSIVK